MKTKVSKKIQIELLEEMKRDLEEQHKCLREGFDALKEHHLFHRDSDQALLNEMHSILVAINHINKYLYPLYWETKNEE